jgi:hypothetical protein
MRQRTLATIHDRMPVIVPPEAFNLWLDCTNVDAETAAALITPAPDNLLEAHEISTAVNRTANDNSKLIEPFSRRSTLSRVRSGRAAHARQAPKTDDGQGALFEETRNLSVRPHLMHRKRGHYVRR